MVTPEENAPGEELEIVDASNRVVGRGERAALHKDEARHRSVHIALFDRAGRLYIHRRSASKSVLPGAWDLSAAGHVEPGETYHEAAIRELEEELVIATPLRLILVTDAAQETGNEFAALFIGEAAPESIQPNPDEIESGEWIDLHELAARFESPGEEVYSPNLVNALMHFERDRASLPRRVRRALDDAERSESPESESRETLGDVLRRQAILPWPGVDVHEPSAKQARRTAMSGPLPSLAAGLERFIRLGLMAMVLLAILAYPIGPPQSWVRSLEIEARLNPGLISTFIADQIVPYMMALNPLLLKENLVSQLVFAALPLFVLLILLRPARPLHREPWAIVIGAFLLLGGVSILTALPDESLFMGIYTMLRILTWTAIVAMAAAAVRSRRQVILLLWVVGAGAGITGLLALMQHMGWKVPLPDLPGSVRNRMASTIGHNNGVAGVSMFLWFLLLAGIFRSTKTAARAAYAIGSGIVLFLILALQTRGIWIVTAVMTPGFLYLAFRVSGWRFRPRIALIAGGLVLAIFLVQSIDSPLNPFHGAISLTKRFQDFSPSKLRTTTQRRILKSALHYMPQDSTRYLTGVGLGGFIYAYPEMQADFYSASKGEADVHLRHLRTLQAHSDVLQLFIETGFIGLLVFLIALFMLTRHMERTFVATPDRNGRLILLSIYFPLLATLFHALGDFPFHVASTSTPFAILLGITLAAPRIFAPRLVELPRETKLQRVIARSAEGKFHPSRFAIAAGCLLLYVPLSLLMFLSNAYFSSDVYQTTARSYIQSYQIDQSVHNTKDGFNALRYSKSLLTSAFRLFPYDPDTYYLRAQAEELIAKIKFAAWLEAREQNADERLSEERRKDVVITLNAVVENVRLAESNGTRFHETAGLAASAYSMLAQADVAQRERHLKNQLASLQRAVWFNPAFAQGIASILTFYAKHQPNSMEEIEFYRGQLKRFNPAIYKQFYHDRYEQAVYGRNFAVAIQYLQILKKDNPDEPLYFFMESGVLAHWGNVDAARRSLAKARERFPDYEQGLDFGMTPALVAKDWREAYDLTSELLKRPEKSLAVPEMTRAVQLFAAERLGLPEAEKLNAEFERLVEKGDEKGLLLLEQASETLYLYFDDLPRAAHYADRRIAEAEQTRSIHSMFHVISAEAALEKGELGKVALRAAHAVSRGAADMRVKQFMARLGDEHPEMIPQIQAQAEELRERHNRRIQEQIVKQYFGPQ